MGIFGEGTPALWEDGKNQVSEVTQVLFITNNIMELTFLNAHDYELGMRIKFDNMYALVDGINLAHYDGWAYIISKTSFTVSIDVNWIAGFGHSATLIISPDVTGYIALDRATLEDPNFIVKDKIVHTSIINGHKNTIKRGNYSSFSLKLNLMRYNALNQQNLMRLLTTWDGGNLLFFPHWDGEYIQDESAAGVEFNVNVMFKYIDSADFRDIGFIELYSQEYTDISKNI